MSCRSAVEIISRSLDAPLSKGERIGLGVHTFYCSPCRRFRRQLLRLDASCESIAAEFMPPAEAGLTAEALDRNAAEIERTRAG